MFNVLEEDEDIQFIDKIIRREIPETEIEMSSLKNEYKYATEQLKNITQIFDFFKSEIVAETLIKIYLIGKKQMLITKIISPFIFLLRLFILFILAYFIIQHQTTK